MLIIGALSLLFFKFFASFSYQMALLISVATSGTPLSKVGSVLEIKEVAQRVIPLVSSFSFIKVEVLWFFYTKSTLFLSIGIKARLCCFLNSSRSSSCCIRFLRRDSLSTSSATFISSIIQVRTLSWSKFNRRQALRAPFSPCSLATFSMISSFSLIIFTCHQYVVYSSSSQRLFSRFFNPRMYNLY